jgi:hypothetical protein
MSTTEDREDISREFAALRAELQSLKDQQAGFTAGFAASASVPSSSTTGEEEAGPFVPYYSTINPHSQRPLPTTDEPQLYSLEHSSTFRELETARGSSLKYEFRTAEPLLSYLFDIPQEIEWLEPLTREHLLSSRSKPPTATEEVNEKDKKLDDLIVSLLSVKNPLAGCYKLLNQRADYIRLKTRFESNPRGMTAAERGLLNYLETKFYGFADGLTLIDSDVSGWIDSFGEKSATAILQQAAKASAGGRGKGGKGGKGKGGKGKGGKGESSET